METKSQTHLKVQVTVRETDSSERDRQRAVAQFVSEHTS